MCKSEIEKTLFLGLFLGVELLKCVFEQHSNP